MFTGLKVSQDISLIVDQNTDMLEPTKTEIESRIQLTYSLHDNL
jgi:hypothetical protein